MGKLTMLSLPLGNAGDISKRAVEIVEKTNFIICEDTRNLIKLCNYLGISVEGKQMVSFHDHSNPNELSKIVYQLKSREALLVSDAGSPMVSDPAFPLVKECISQGIEIDTIPGPSAPIAALELSGLPPTPFHFHGFISRDSGPRKKYFNDISTVAGTHIFFEGVSRVLKFIEEMSSSFPESQIVVARELTKLHQSVYRFLGKDFDDVKNSIIEKGEFVILVHLEAKKTVSTSDLSSLANDILEKGARPKLIAKLIAEILGENHKDIYAKLNRGED